MAKGTRGGKGGNPTFTFDGSIDLGGDDNDIQFEGTLKMGGVDLGVKGVQREKIEAWEKKAS